MEDLLDPSFTARAKQGSTAELREAIRSCESAEMRLSYGRRLLHGRIDLVRAELGRRGGSGRPGAVVDRLAEILSDAPTGTRRGSHAPIPTEAPDEEPAPAALARLPDLADDELDALSAELVDKEARISAERRKLHGVIDELKDELVRRYRSGDASASDVLPG